MKELLNDTIKGLREVLYILTHKNPRKDENIDGKIDELSDNVNRLEQMAHDKEWDKEENYFFQRWNMVLMIVPTIIGVIILFYAMLVLFNRNDSSDFEDLATKEDSLENQNESLKRTIDSLKNVKLISSITDPIEKLQIQIGELGKNRITFPSTIGINMPQYGKTVPFTVPKRFDFYSHSPNPDSKFSYYSLKTAIEKQNIKNRNSATDITTDTLDLRDFPGDLLIIENNTRYELQLTTSLEKPDYFYLRNGKIIFPNEYVIFSLRDYREFERDALITFVNLNSSARGKIELVLKRD